MGIDPAIAPTCCGTTNAYNTPAWTGVRFTDNGDGTVTDNVTALIWLKNANCTTFFSDDSTGHNYRNWRNALTAANSLEDGYCGVTDGSSAGDWRLPNVNELHSLVDLTQSNPPLPSGHHFDGVQSYFYWSSTTYADYTANAWGVFLYGGDVCHGYRTGTFYVWPVRGGQ
jgi:hypothetical protein